MKATIYLLWHKLFNRKNLIKITYNDNLLWFNKNEYGYLINISGTVSGKEELAKHIKDGWVVKTDGLYPKHLILRDKIVWFFKFKVYWSWFDLLKWLLRKFPKLNNLPENHFFWQIFIWPYRKVK